MAPAGDKEALWSYLPWEGHLAEQFGQDTRRQHPAISPQPSMRSHVGVRAATSEVRSDANESGGPKP